MAKRIYVGVGNTARRVKKAYVGINGLARRIKKAYIGVGGVARILYTTELDYWGRAKPLSLTNAHPAATSNSKYALFAGGYNTLTNKYHSRVEAYSKSLTKVSAPDLDNECSGPVSASLDNVSLFSYGSPGCINAYDLSLTKSTVTEGNENKYRKGMRGARIGNYAAFVDGVTYSGKWIAAKCIDTYDASLTYSQKGQCYGRYYHSVVFNGTHAVVAGGQEDWNTGGYSNWDLDFAEAFDLSFTRTIIDKLSKKREGMAAVAVGKYILFMGGENIRAISVGDRYESEIYDVVDAYDDSLTRISAPSLSHTLVCSTNYDTICATVIHNQYALVSLGENLPIDVYDSALTKTTRGKLSRSNASATTIDDYALFAGGSYSSGSYTISSDSVDVYAYMQ